MGTLLLSSWRERIVPRSSTDEGVSVTVPWKLSSAKPRSVQVKVEGGRLVLRHLHDA